MSARPGTYLSRGTLAGSGRAMSVRGWDRRSGCSSAAISDAVSVPSRTMTAAPSVANSWVIAEVASISSMSAAASIFFSFVSPALLVVDIGTGSTCSVSGAADKLRDSTA